MTPASVETRIETLEFVDGADPATTETVYDHLDLLRGVGTVNDAFFRFVVDMGRPGPDRGEGVQPMTTIWSL